MAEYTESICRRCFHSYVCEQFNEHRDDNNKKCHFFNDHFVPAADVAPVRHGRWEAVKNPQWPAYSHDKCSICGWWNTKNALCYDGHKKPGHSLNYCPNCGAKMDLEGGNT